MSNTIPPGTYQETSRNVSIKKAEEGRIIIVAECLNTNGDWVSSKLKYDIANCDGQLKFAPNGC